MIMAFAEAASGVRIYINPSFVARLRPYAADPERTTVVRLSGGETLRLRGGDEDVAARLSRRTAAG